jgi:hypothetical protein
MASHELHAVVGLRQPGLVGLDERRRDDVAGSSRTFTRNGSPAALRRVVHNSMQRTAESGRT